MFTPRQVANWNDFKAIENSAVVEIDETAENANLMTQSKGVVIVNYKELKDLNLTISAFWDGFLYANESCERAYNLWD